MKIKLILAILTMAIAAQAASFTWKSDVITFNGAMLTSGVTAYLVYLDSDTSVSSLYTISYEGTGSITGAESVQTSTPKTGLVGKGTISSTYDDAAIDKTLDGTKVAPGKIFGMYLVYNDGVDNWYNFTTSTAAMTADPTGAFEAKTFGFNFSDKTTIDAEGGAPAGWTRISMVPEPATGALALAGIALLLKRRKAAKA